MSKLSAFIVLPALWLILFSCVKKPADQTVNHHDTGTRGRIIEVGSNAPISGASVITLHCARNDMEFGCVDWTSSTVITDVDGKFLVNNFRNHSIQKEGYWPYTDEPDVNCWGFSNCGVLPTPITYFISAGQLDSMLIKLFPITTVTVHVKTADTLTAWLECQAIFDGRSRPGKSIYLRAPMDSSFQFPVFGNAENRIFIKRQYPLADTALQSRYIQKGEAVTLSVNY